MSKRNEASGSEETPSKKPRLMGPPDGFSAKPRPKPLSKPSAPKFTSAFDDAPAPVKRALKAPEVIKPPKPVSASRTTLEAKPGMRALKPPVPLFNPVPKPAPPLQLAVPPAPRIPPPIPAAEPSRHSHNATALRHLAPPPVPSTPALAFNSKQTISLKPLLPPRLPAPFTPASDGTMRTISTTLLARATDLFTDNGTSELASLLLHDQHPNIELWDETDVDERRGVMVSPEKGGGKGKEKFIKNGLAARARALFDRQNSSLSLWEAEMNHTLSSSSSFRRLNPDIRLRILYILRIPTPVAKPSSKLPIPGVALCHILAAPAADPFASPPFPRIKDDVVAVLFSFSSLSPPPHQQAQTQLHIRNPEDFVEGREVYVWKPWQALAINASALKLCVKTETIADAESADDASSDAFDQFFGPDAVKARHREKISETALVCERFVILR